MKNRAHFFRMNPQTLPRRRLALNSTTLAAVILAAALATLFWIGSIRN